MEQTMKALAVHKDHTLEVVELPIPEIGDDCVLTKTIASGICNGTDSKIIHGEYKVVRDYPCLLGHEAVGRVIKVGKKVASFKVGDHVMVPFLETDEHNQYAGYYSYWSGYAQYTVARDWKAMVAEGKGPGHPEFWDAYYTQQVLPKDIDPVDGVMIVTFCEVLAAIRNFGIKKEHSVVIFGAGAVGLSFVRLLKLLGTKTVISVDVDEKKREAAKEAGADLFINSKEQDVEQAVCACIPEKADIVLDAVGLNALVETALHLIKANGRVCVYGISPHKQLNFSWEDAPSNWELKYLHEPVKEQQAEAFEQIVEWVRNGDIDLKEYISHRIPFDHILEAFDLVMSPESKKKVVITYE